MGIANKYELIFRRNGSLCKAIKQNFRFSKESPLINFFIEKSFP